MVESDFSEKFNDLTKEKYAYIILSSAKISKKGGSVLLTFIYPEDKESDIASGKREIEAAAKTALGTELDVKVKLRKSHFSREHFLGEIRTFLKRHPAVFSMLEPGSIDAQETDSQIYIKIKASDGEKKYILDAGIDKEITRWFAYRYCQQVILDFIDDDASIQAGFIAKKAELEREAEIPVSSERRIRVENCDEFIGPIIYETAGYISDAHPQDRAVLCGRIESFSELRRKPKNPEDTEERKFYKFTLRDFTGSISCVYFPSASSKQKIQLLNDGKSIIAAGKIEKDNFRGDGSLSFMIREITLCTLPAEFSEQRIKKKVNSEYIQVKPAPYFKERQENLFERSDPVPEYLKNKAFCVFDVETTGLKPESDDIIELGAVIVEDGKIKESFSSYIHTDMLIPEKITQLTGITNKDTTGQPEVKDVLTDFYKFSYGLPLVGQNVGFDYSFISEKGKKYNLYFDNERIDTITLAKRYLKDLKKFSLDKIADRLDVKNEAAHRAIHDAVATAEIFIKLSKYIEN